MATIINNPDTGVERDSGAGVAIGIIVALLVILLILFFGIPFLRGEGNNTPETDGASLDVNLNTGGTPGGDGGGGGGQQ